MKRMQKKRWREESMLQFLCTGVCVCVWFSKVKKMSALLSFFSGRRNAVCDTHSSAFFNEAVSKSSVITWHVMIVQQWVCVRHQLSSEISYIRWSYRPHWRRAWMDCQICRMFVPLPIVCKLANSVQLPIFVDFAHLWIGWKFAWLQSCQTSHIHWGSNFLSKSWLEEIRRQFIAGHLSNIFFNLALVAYWQLGIDRRFQIRWSVRHMLSKSHITALPEWYISSKSHMCALTESWQFVNKFDEQLEIRRNCTWMHCLHVRTSPIDAHFVRIIRGCIGWKFAIHQHRHILRKFDQMLEFRWNRARMYSLTIRNSAIVTEVENSIQA